MTHRERLLAVLARKPPDRIPWVPRLLLWYNAHRLAGTLPERYQGWSLRDIERDLGLGTPARNGTVFTTRLHGVEVQTQHQNDQVLTTYTTPVGTVSRVHKESATMRRVGIGSLEVEHPIKRPEDYEVMAYIVEHTEYLPRYEDYQAYEAEIGEDGVPMVSLGDCPIHQIMREWVGYERFFYDLYDHPARIERLLQIMEEKKRELWRIAAESPALLFLHGVHFDSTITPPPLFAHYFVPYFHAFNGYMHDHGKVVTCHADADTRLLLELVMEAGFDMAECFTCAPMVSCTLEEARRVWGTRVIIWGAVPSVILCDSTPEEEFETYMADLFRVIAPGDAFILGVGDNVMPEAKLERVIRISEMVETYGGYPLNRRETPWV